MNLLGLVCNYRVPDNVSVKHGGNKHLLFLFGYVCVHKVVIYHICT